MSADDPLRVRGLRKTFGDLVALDDVSLDVERGTTSVLLGPSGSGKSTLLRCLNLLEKPDAGSIDLGEGPIEVGGKLTTARVREIRSRSTMVFQQFNLFPHLTALGNVTLAPRENRGLSRQAAEQRGRELLEKVGLADKADSYPDRLSGGQQQRVAIARALAMAPQVMFFDEATSALDPELVKGVLALIAELGQDGMTMVVVTHEMGFARSAADAVLFMDYGKVVETGTPEQIFSDASTDRLRQFLSQVL